ncbi:MULTISPECIES: DUF488 family protein [unclassified Mesorhizobium]|uniref:DUF488 domain-containing protein n=1 Tax=unclassified Mesorhizobium TaxID=325217 RepID=UPI00112D95F9|nr:MULTISPECIES: DUF488 domain-containing protein [unclassified Mesorhizobium]TPJ48681.1 DUF488 domain-containing protein [Mesorhizobium sp. B2-6-6]MCA0000067.1 DUF488 domain-containing protein [Mesorhizobium sp. B264B2A]MCA0006118.1 DUF488 domain-containing protein [Mesorhizobium sp. B264B1B]MCA0022414.1 DUF488 domain-containing protein [Mesorhizobium sp. B264B1A]TPJ68171.1 DUF488 domain-containing protein [Mesorhizobium sp. B2-6-7]
MMHSIPVSTIGFTKSTAERFFERLLNANVKKLIDVRLNNTSQLAGFAKAEDLAYFLRKIGGIQYVHQPMLAPTANILDAYRKEKGDWSAYEKQFTQLLESRKIEDRLRPDMFDGTCLLCSEATPHHCHRRLVCEYLNSKWGSPLKVRHL